MLPITFAANANQIHGQVAMYGCVAEWLAFNNALFEGNMSSLDSLPQSDMQVPNPLGNLAIHAKDPMPRWISPKGLADRC